MPERYAMINAAHVVVNITLWDGITPWTPPDGETPILIGARACDRGYTYDPATGLFSPPS